MVQPSTRPFWHHKRAVCASCAEVVQKLTVVTAPAVVVAASTVVVAAAAALVVVGTRRRLSGKAGHMLGSST